MLLLNTIYFIDSFVWNDDIMFPSSERHNTKKQIQLEHIDVPKYSLFFLFVLTVESEKHFLCQFVFKFEIKKNFDYKRA